MAPTPALFAACPEAVRMLNDLPPFVREDPDIRAVIYCYGKEAERKRALRERLRAQLFPQTADELGLPWWEQLLRTTVAPPAATVAQRRQNVRALLLKSISSPAGRDWVSNVSAFIGESWAYQEHIPGDPTSPPEYTVSVSLPYPPESDLYQQTERVLREITPWHLDLIVTYSGGFVLDQSQLDQEAMQ